MFRFVCGKMIVTGDTKLVNTVKSFFANVGTSISCKYEGKLCQREEGRNKMRNRQKQRELRRQQKKEELLDRRSSCGVKDLTAYNAVAAMKFGSKATIALR